jgi:hypothetical protein
MAEDLGLRTIILSHLCWGCISLIEDSIDLRRGFGLDSDVLLRLSRTYIPSHLVDDPCIDRIAILSI